LLGIVLATSVAVDLSALDASARERLDAERLHGQLVVRLAEEGHGVRDPSQPTSYRIELHMASARTVRIRAVGAETRSELLALGPRRVLHLAIVQRVLVLLDDLPPAPAGAAILPRVFIHYPARTDEEAANRTYGSVAVQLIARGFELVGSPGRADRSVCVSPDGQQVWLPTGPAPGRCDPAGEVDDAGEVGAAGDMVVPTSIGSFGEMVSALMAVPEGAPRAAVRRRSATPSLVLARASADRDPRAGWTLAASTGAAMRFPPTGRETDPSLALTVRFGREAGPCAAATARFSVAPGDGSPLLGMTAAAGPGWRLGTGLVSVGAFALAGGMLHRSEYAPWGPMKSWAWVVLAPLDVSARVVGSWRVHGTALAGLVGEGSLPLSDRELDRWGDGRVAAFEAGMSVTF
jgi:hypothetical protein